MELFEWNTTFETPFIFYLEKKERPYGFIKHSLCYRSIVFYCDFPSAGK